jgi:hypothetical protein
MNKKEEPPYCSVFNTFQNRPSFERTLASFLYNRDCGGPILVVADCCSPRPSIFPHHHINASNPGVSRRIAWELALETGAQIIAAMDDDLLFSPSFDSWSLNTLSQAEPGWVVTPYRSPNPQHLSFDIPTGSSFTNKNVGGNCIFAHRTTILSFLASMPASSWDYGWDWNLGAHIKGCIKPPKSLVKHVGFDGLHGNLLSSLSPDPNQRS